MVDEETCAACSFYQQDNDCQRTLEWVHRVELTQATKQGVTQWGEVSHLLGKRSTPWRSKSVRHGYDLY
jgi:hypothetical protein